MMLERIVGFIKEKNILNKSVREISAAVCQQEWARNFKGDATRVRMVL